ncbi:MAG TPA: D-galactonate dehydratase family protein [Aggregatilineales bacterium]|nr:D-galactonate dehydratase family protein [Aggregatilineales bacterium]
MAITEVKVIVTCPGRNYTLVKVMTDQGVYGVGDGTLNGSELVVAEMIRHIGQLIVGHDEDRIGDIWQMLYHWGYWRNGPIFKVALGAIDVALWDIKGKKAGMPVYQLLGGRAREGAMVYGHAHGGDPAAVEDSVRTFIARGYKAIRAQPGPYGGAGMIQQRPPRRPGLPPTDIFEPTPYLLQVPPLFAHLRDKLGMEVELLHDVHEQLTSIQSARLAKALEPYRLFFLEDALRPEYPEGFRLIRAQSTTPLAMGELFTSREQCLALFKEQWIDYIRIAPIHVGGITEAHKICVLAEPYQIKSAFHGAADIGPIGQAAAVSLDVVIPNFGVQEWTAFPEAAYEVMPGACQMRDGYAYPNEEPGLGLDIREDLAAKYPYQEVWMPLVRRADGTVHVY